MHDVQNEHVVACELNNLERSSKLDGKSLRPFIEKDFFLCVCSRILYKTLDEDCDLVEVDPILVQGDVYF